MNEAKAPSDVVQTKSVWLESKVETLADMPASLHLREAPLAPVPDGMACVEVHASAVNPSDVKAALGNMPSAVFPRIPGRDFAGVVVAGPAELIGQEVWGSGGDTGIKQNGAHGRHVVVDARSLRRKPKNLTMAEAGAVGVPFVTALQGFEEAGGIRAGDVVAVMGANGKVGQAAVQIAAMRGARVFAVMRGAALKDQAPANATALDAAGDVAAAIRAATDGHGADIIFNTVGSPYFDAANKALAKLGRQIFIATLDRAVPFDIFAFYRGRHRFVGCDSLALTHVEAADYLEKLRSGFECGALKPFPIAAHAIYRLDQLGEAYQHVLSGTQDRIVLDPTS
jgi:NADPH2:quinone reductase